MIKPEHAQKIAKALGDHVHSLREHLDHSLKMQEAIHKDAMAKMDHAVKMLAAPKRVIRGPDGRIAGLE